jgi:hypothetical protein
MIHARQAAWLLAGTASLAVAGYMAPARVSGRVATPDGRPLIGVAVAMAPSDEGAPVRPQSATIAPDGSFSFSDVPPGNYEIRARGQTGKDGPTLFGTFTLSVATRDIANVEVALREGGTLEGHLALHRARGVRPPPLSSLIVRAPLTDGSGFGDALTGRVTSGGSFAIRGLMAGTHHVLIEGLPDTWTVESVRLRGRDVTGAPFDVAGRERFDDVRVVMTDSMTRVDLHVEDRSGPAADAAVAVFAASPALWIHGGGRVRFTRTDAAGNAAITGLPSGAYLAAASRSIDARATPLAHTLEPLRSGATAFSLAAAGAGARLTLRLDESPAVRE